MTKQEIEANLIFLFVRGSNAYGTNTPESDEDFGGVCMPNKAALYGIEKFEQDDKWVDERGEKVDKSIYSLMKTVDLLKENNPNMLDFLYAPERCIRVNTPQWERIRAIRDSFMCSQAKWAYQGYAVSQLNRIEMHRGFLLSPVAKPDRVAMGLPAVSIFPETQIEVIARLSSEYVDADGMDDFMTESTRLFDTYGSLIFKKYISPDYYSFAIADFKKRQKEFLRMISSISQHFLKDEYLGMAHKELQFLSHQKKWDAYLRWKKGRNEHRAAMEAKSGFDCYTSDTEFLTSVGWLLYDDIHKDIKLATMNQQTGRVEYHLPIERFDAMYNGVLYNFNGTHTDINVTANHNMWVRDVEKNNDKYTDWKFVQASMMHNAFDILTGIVPKICTSKVDSGYIVGNVKLSTMDYLRIMGWYISEGSCMFRKDKVKSVCISQSKPNSALMQSITKLINKTKLTVGCYVVPVRSHQNYPEQKWVFGREVAQLLYNDCGHGSHIKRIPRWVFNLTKRKLDVLLKSLLQGDGTQRKHSDSTFIYYSVSKLLASDVQELAFMCGYESSLWGPYTNGIYHVHINTKASAIKRMYRSKNITKKEVRDERIVCFTVPNNILITRRHGKIAIQGNCKHAMHLIRLLRMSIEIMDGRGVLVDRTNIDRDELMEIRNGHRTFESILEESAKLNAKADELYKTCKLPEHPNRELIDGVMIDMLDQHIR